MSAFLRWLLSFRLRLLFRTAFVLLILALAALALAVLQGEKQRSLRNYQSSLAKTKEQIVTRLRHPSGQLALLNPEWSRIGKLGVRPVLLPFSAIDFDDRNKVRHAVEMADCLIRYERQGSLCVGIGGNPWGGGFIYAAGDFFSPPLTPHAIGDRYLDGATRMQVRVRLRGQQYRWIAPFEIPPSTRPEAAEADGIHGRFTAYVELDGRDYNLKKPVREFRGWVWQDANCRDPRRTDADCVRPGFFSLRLPVPELIAPLLRDKRSPWPPPDLNEIGVDIRLLPPGEAGAASQALFDSAASDAIPPFSLNDLGELLQPGETLHIRREHEERDIATINGKIDVREKISPQLTRLIQRLPSEGAGPEATAPIDLTGTVATPNGNYRIILHGDPERVVIENLSAVATRLSWLAGGVLAAIALAWLVIELGIVSRIARMTRRAQQFPSWREESEFMAFDFADLEGHDELGILADRLDRLLARVKEDASRERIRVAQEKEQWHAVGHEIMSPLQSLLALYGDPQHPAHRYLARMQQAIRVLYGSASPSEAFQASTLALNTLDLDEFLRNIATNAPHVGIDNVRYRPQNRPILVRADEYSLEDVFSHLLNNANRCRRPDTPITLSLAPSAEPGGIVARVHNVGPSIPDEYLEKIFEYGFCGAAPDPAPGAAHGDFAGDSVAAERPADSDTTDDNRRRGQGLFVAKTYLAKMGGTLAAVNEDDGVSFYLHLQAATER